jgi:response regulator RpfG family c-di-GMP phosphodiesterase
MNKDFLKQLTVLYVEDQDEIRTFTSNILSSFLKKLIVCSNGEEGIDSFKKNPDINLIITDINMPKMNGLEMVKRINQLNPNIPTITTTAHTDSNFYKKSIDLGITSYCLKPLDLYELIKNITKLLEHKILKEDIKNELAYEVDIESTKTVKGISEELEKIGLINALYSMIERKANEQIKTWFPTSNVEALILEEKEVTGW